MRVSTIRKTRFLKNDPPPEPSEQIPYINIRYAAFIGEIPGSPVIRRRTSKNGIIIFPLFDPTTRISIKIDAWGPRIGPGFPAILRDPAPPPDNDGPSPRLDPWPGEEQFLTMTLEGTLVAVRRSPDDDADAPDPSTEEQNLGLRQRLYDLGYGGGDWRIWTKEHLARAVNHFQENHPPLKVTGTADGDTIGVLLAATGEFTRSATPKPTPATKAS